MSSEHGDRTPKTLLQLREPDSPHRPNSSSALARELELIREWKEKMEANYEKLRRNTIGRNARARLEEALGPLPIGDVGESEGGKTETDLTETMWRMSETQGPFEDGLRVYRNLRLALDTGSVEGSSQVRRPMPNSSTDFRELRRGITIRLSEEDEKWGALPMRGVIAQWERRTGHPQRLNENVINMLYLLANENGDYVLKAKFSSDFDKEPHDLTDALHHDTGFWTTPDGKPTEDAKRLKSFFGVDRELLEGFGEGPNLGDLARHVLSAEEPPEVPY